MRPLDLGAGNPVLVPVRGGAASSDDVEIDGHWGFSSITHAIGSAVNSVSNAVSTAASTVSDAASTAWSATTTWVSDHKAEIVGAVVGTVVGLGCEVATAGAGSLGCAALGGAVGNMVTYGMKTPSDQWTAGGFLTSGATGAAAGMVGFGAGKVLAAGGSKVIGAFARDAAEGAEEAAGSGLSRLTAEEARLPGRADELADALDPIARNHRTPAAMSTAEGRDVLAGGVRDLSPAQRALAGEDDVLAKMPGEHAEVTGMKKAAEEGLTPTAIGTSRDICTSCRAALEESGATIISARFAAWLDFF